MKGVLLSICGTATPPILRTCTGNTCTPNGLLMLGRGSPTVPSIMKSKTGFVVCHTTAVRTNPQIQVRNSAVRGTQKLSEQRCENENDRVKHLLGPCARPPNQFLVPWRMIFLISSSNSYNFTPAHTHSSCNSRRTMPCR